MGDETRWSSTRHGVGPISTIRTIVTEPSEAFTTTLEPGLRLGKYELIREIGRGGMGVVYVARDTRLGRLVAIKFLLSSSRTVAQRFLAEARATATCTHDNIVIIHEADEYEGMPFMVLELLVGKTLRELIATSGQLPPSRVLDLMVPVARALQRAHDLGIVHRDLKPENIFVTAAGQVKVLDFGIAKALDSIAHGGRPDGGPSADLSLTSEGGLIGTLPYMAPEQVTGGEVDHRVDLWACGVILFELLAGHHPVTPFSSEAIFECLVGDGPMPSIRPAVPTLAPGLVAVVDACLQKSSDRRLATAGELVSRLEQQLPARIRGTQDAPFPGLAAFQESDAGRFFGRTRDVARVVARVREQPLVAVVGPSGVGKSSFVRAGVVPSLKASGERWEMIDVRPGRSPMMTLAGIARRLEERDVMVAGQRTGLETSGAAATLIKLYREPGYLGSLLRRHARELGSRIVLVIDQLEEAYTLCSEVKERDAFMRTLAGVADDPASPLRVVVTMRSDLIDRVAETLLLRDDITRGLVLLAPPDLEGLREALVAPIELANYQFETPSMIDEMLGALTGMPGALPLLQFAAAKLWDARDRDRKVLTLASYHAIGGVAGALASHADDVIASLDASSRQVARDLLRRLVTPERTRAIVERADLDPTTRAVVDRLVGERLLVVQTHVDAGPTVELIHESLIDRWPTLRRWLDEDQDDAAFADQIAAAAKQWDVRGRPSGLLWTGDAFLDAERWARTRPRTLPDRDREFLDAAFALARRGKRRRRFALIGAFATLAVIAAGATIALVVVRDANARAEAEYAEKLRLESEGRQTEEARRRAVADTQRAETARSQAASERDMAQTEVESKQRELERKNTELQRALDDARGEKTKAERATIDAKRAADEANQARARLSEALDAEKLRVKQLENEKKKLTTKLKD